MRGVVTLAVALSLPENMLGRELIVFSGFAVILLTVLLQGTAMGPLIGGLSLRAGRERSAIHPLVHDADGAVIHPRLLEQYTYRAPLSQRFQDMEDFPTGARHAHYDIVLSAIAAGRAELLRMHRSGFTHDELLHSLEHEFDLQEIAAVYVRG